MIVFILSYRTKWKRQTAVGLELLAEAGNYAAFQRLYGAPAAYLGAGWPYPPPVGPPVGPPPPPGGHGGARDSGRDGVPQSPADLYYRQVCFKYFITLIFLKIVYHEKIKNYRSLYRQIS